MTFISSTLSSSRFAIASSATGGLYSLINRNPDSNESSSDNQQSISSGKVSSLSRIPLLSQPSISCLSTNPNRNLSNVVHCESATTSWLPFASDGGSSKSGTKLEIGGVDVGAMMPDKPEWVKTETLQPLAGGLSFGTASGLVAGVACKKIGKAVAVGVGSLYVLFQVTASYGYITIDWKAVERDVMKAIDTNGDGKIDQNDANQWLGKIVTMLSNEGDEGKTAKNASVGGFAGGFVVGIKKG